MDVLAEIAEIVVAIARLFVRVVLFFVEFWVPSHPPEPAPDDSDRRQKK